MNRPLSSTLQDLIVLVEHKVTRPQSNADGDAVLTIVGEIKAAEHRPTDQPRTTRAALVAAIALDSVTPLEDTAHDDCWLAVLGVLLPALRADLFQQLTNEREGMRE